MLIGELAKKTGHSKDTLRYYTKLGLIDAGNREAGNKMYADYSDEVVERLKEIQLAKSAGFTLTEIRAAIVEYNNGELTPSRMVELYSSKLEEVRTKQKELKEVESMLKKKIAHYLKAE